MKPVRTKKDLQADLQAQVEAFLSHGGNIRQVERGQSGLSHEKPWINPFKSGETEKAASRTPLPDVVAAIDARKQSKKKPTPKRRKPEKIWILDDFGEPVRWVWSDQS
ncbi:hypothetical protein [Reinekea sp. G2M2-21]|uniref:hypothetical protein n=1 Tax=Reinekea sp. G2M2-21 TaxID=2788942 RepID=UPI0018A8D3B5|nr:hypothetical protein [Reinekea sp. G2M2-21]MDX1341682.1 hypothetical protein [Reinekea sp.]